MRKVYMDHAGAMPLLPEIREAMLPYLDEIFGNPQSLHSWGDGARDAVEEARERVASLIGGSAEEIIFTASGTEANNLAIKGLARAKAEKGKHIVISAVEHFSVMNSARTLQKEGFEVTFIPVNGFGVVDPDEVFHNIRSDTVLVSIMHANGEVGTIEPIAEIAKRLLGNGPVFHTDAVASTGNMPVDVKTLGVHALSLAGNQFYGPKGGAALWLKRGVRMLPLMDGGIQEGGRRPGTEDVPAIVGLGKAAELAQRDLNIRMQTLTQLRDSLIKGVLSQIEHSMLTGHPVQRLPAYASFCLNFIEGEAILMLLNSHGIAAASGSACTSRALKASHVLLAMGISHEVAQGSMLFSLGLDNTEDDINYVLEKLPQVVDRLRQMSPLYSKYIKEQRG
ncbi:MAG: aminotransferase class V-fold PLP-dependent enzyme [Dehalococcoidia bacterium]|nr:aminotransferase class V-fold PLP-dependent enzyme [Dehalococcoidia bacterium]MDD5493617.1 aminotransferase class V-fold PLP-dependent enzyme [Dehalococcoidia bacterium]